MKQINFITFILLIITTTISSAQEPIISSPNYQSEKSKLSFGFNAGIGQNINGYRLNPDKYDFTYSEGNIHFTTGLNIAYFFTERLRPRFEFKFSEISYGLNWSEPYTDFDNTTTKLSALDFNLNFDYMLINHEKYQLFLSPGVTTETIIKEKNKNYLVDGTSNTDNYYVVTGQYPKKIAGANLSLIAKYKINANLGITASPGFNYYFKKFCSSNDKSYMRTLFNFGIEYSVPF